jgi:hypothetical protein
LTATSFGDATGTVGVNVKAGGGVEEGSAVLIGIEVDNVAEVFVARIVAVGVPGALEGRLQASMLRSNKKTAKNG